MEKTGVFNIRGLTAQVVKQAFALLKNRIRALKSAGGFEEDEPVSSASSVSDAPRLVPGETAEMSHDRPAPTCLPGIGDTPTAPGEEETPAEVSRRGGWTVSLSGRSGMGSSMAPVAGVEVENPFEVLGEEGSSAAAGGGGGPRVVASASPSGRWAGGAPADRVVMAPTVSRRPGPLPTAVVRISTDPERVKALARSVWE